MIFCFQPPRTEPGNLLLKKCLDSCYDGETCDFLHMYICVVNLVMWVKGWCKCKVEKQSENEQSFNRKGKSFAERIISSPSYVNLRGSLYCLS